MGVKMCWIQIKMGHRYSKLVCCKGWAVSESLKIGRWGGGGDIHECFLHKI